MTDDKELTITFNWTVNDRYYHMTVPQDCQGQALYAAYREMDLTSKVVLTVKEGLDIIVSLTDKGIPFSCLNNFGAVDA